MLAALRLLKRALGEISAALLLAGCGGSKGGLADEAVLAQVEGHPITLAAYRQQVARVPAHLQEQLDPQRYLQGLIDEELLVQEARRRGLDRSEEVERAVQQEARVLALRELYRRQGIEAPQPTEEELQAYFAKSPYNRRVRFSLLMVKSPDQLPPLLAQLKAGADFDSLSALHSQDPRILQRQADMGYHRWSETMPSHAALAEKAFSMEPGQIAGPIKVADGYFLIKVTDVQPVSLDQERETIAQLVVQEQLRERLSGYYAGLHQQYGLQLDEVGFQALAAEGMAPLPPASAPVPDPHAAHQGHAPPGKGMEAHAMHRGHPMDLHAGHGAPQALADTSAARGLPGGPPPSAPLADPQQTLATYQGNRLTIEQCRPFLQADAPRNPEALRHYLINQLCRQVLAPLEIGRLELLKTPAVQEGLEKARRRALIRQLQTQIAAPVQQPNHNAVRIYFEEHRDRYALPAQVPPFEAVQDQVAADFVQEQGSLLFQKFVEELRTRSAQQIRIDQENLQKLALLAEEGHSHE